MKENLYDLVWDYIGGAEDESKVNENVKRAFDELLTLGDDDSLAVMRFYYEAPHLLLNCELQDLFESVSSRFPENFFITFLLACLYFDRCEYTDSFPLLEKLLHHEILNQPINFWRKAKILEMLASAQLELANFDSEYVEMFLNYYRALDEEDQPAPVELLQTLSRLSVCQKNERLVELEKGLKKDWPKLQLSN